MRVSVPVRSARRSPRASLGTGGEFGRSVMFAGNPAGRRRRSSRQAGDLDQSVAASILVLQPSCSPLHSTRGPARGPPPSRRQRAARCCPVQQARSMVRGTCRVAVGTDEASTPQAVQAMDARWRNEQPVVNVRFRRVERGLPAAAEPAPGSRRVLRTNSPRWPRPAWLEPGLVEQPPRGPLPRPTRPAAVGQGHDAARASGSQTSVGTRPEHELFLHRGRPWVPNRRSRQRAEWNP